MSNNIFYVKYYFKSNFEKQKELYSIMFIHFTPKLYNLLEQHYKIEELI